MGMGIFSTQTKDLLLKNKFDFKHIKSNLEQLIKNKEKYI